MLLALPRKLRVRPAKLVQQLVFQNMGGWLMYSRHIHAPGDNLYETRPTRGKWRLVIPIQLLISPAERSLYVLGWESRESIVNIMVHTHSVGISHVYS